jgi:hypothetical protein
MESVCILKLKETFSPDALTSLPRMTDVTIWGTFAELNFSPELDWLVMDVVAHGSVRVTLSCIKSFTVPSAFVSVFAFSVV